MAHIGRIALAIVLCCSALSAAKKPKPPSQPDITIADCIRVENIRFGTGFTDDHVLTATVVNGCPVAATVVLQLAYFGPDKVTQVDDGLETMVVAPGAKYPFRARPSARYQVWYIQSTKIIGAKAY